MNKYETLTNESVYMNSCRDIVLSSLEGINGTIFMYGQTGAGKTYTMLGDYSKEIRDQADQMMLLRNSGNLHQRRPS